MARGGYANRDTGAGAWSAIKSLQSSGSLPQRKTRIRRAPLTLVKKYGTGDGATGPGSMTLSVNTVDPWVPPGARKGVTAANGTAGSIETAISPTVDISSKAGSQLGLAIAYRITTTAYTDIGNPGGLQFIGYMPGQTGISSIANPDCDPVYGEFGLKPIQTDSTAATALNDFYGQLGGSGGKQPSLEFDSLFSWPTDGLARVVVFGDDGTSDQYDMARRAIGKGIKFCIAIIPGSLDTPGFLTTAQARDLQDNYGVEMVPHAYTIEDHNNLSLYLDPVAWEASMKNLRDTLVAKGLTSGIENYCFTPNFSGARQTAAQKTASDTIGRYFPGLHRTFMGNFLGDSVESQSPYYNERHLRTGGYQSNGNGSTANLNTMLDRAAAIDGVAIVVYHKLAASDGAGYAGNISAATFDAHMSAVAARANAATAIRSCTLTEAFAA